MARRKCRNEACPRKAQHMTAGYCCRCYRQATGNTVNILAIADTLLDTPDADPVDEVAWEAEREAIFAALGERAPRRRGATPRRK